MIKYYRAEFPEERGEHWFTQFKGLKTFAFIYKEYPKELFFVGEFPNCIPIGTKIKQIPKEEFKALDPYKYKKTIRAYGDPELCPWDKINLFL